jgi:hypothetical protein
VPSIKTLRQAPESERIAFLRSVVDDACARLTGPSVDEAGARELVAAVRFQARLLVPDRMDTFDRIYGSRLERLIEQFVRPRPAIGPAAPSAEEHDP